MTTVAMSGSDTININNRVLADLANGNCVELKFTNEKANVTTGKNGNAIYGLNETGRQCEVTVRLVRASSDDKFLNGLMAQQDLNFGGFPLLIGQFIKKVGDGAGNITSDTYVMSGGIFTKGVESMTNVEGDVNQSISVYTMKFATAPRAIG